jgi:hypothetical protein
MLESQQFESLIRIVSAMDRDDLTDRLLHFRGQFSVDFTPDYLGRLSLDRLKHIFVAVCLQAGQVPSDAIAAAA